METLYIKGGNSLVGELDIATSKNAILPILAGSIMCSGEVVIENCTMYSDVLYMNKILEDLGCSVCVNNKNIIVNASVANNFFVTEEYTKKVRSSVFMLGPLLSKFKQAKVAYPGGCNIGNRPIDLHLKGLQSLNVKISELHGYICCDGKNMRSSDVHLDFPSVGATENIMMASIFLKGKTTIYNSAREPEIVDLQNFINSMGGNVSGAGSSTITIIGVNKLNSTTYKPISDRVIAGTYIIAGAVAGGDILIKNTIPEHNYSLLDKLKHAGAKIKVTGNNIRIIVKNKLKSVPRIETQPFPGFPTDLQNQILVLQSISKGTSVINENLFETRFKIATELAKMGADISINGQIAVVKGVNKLYGANVFASDLRGGASLVLAGLCAEGYTSINDIYHIDRGYKNIETDLRKLNADIKRIIE